MLNLGLMLAQEGAVDEALPRLHAAEERGLAEASWAIGKVLEGREDLQGAATAYRRGADAGIADAACGLGSVLEKLGDREGARAAFQRAQDLGHEGASRLLETMDIEVTAHASAAKWVQLVSSPRAARSSQLAMRVSRSPTELSALGRWPLGARRQRFRFRRSRATRKRQNGTSLRCTALSRLRAPRLVTPPPSSGRSIAPARIRDTSCVHCRGGSSRQRGDGEGAVGRKLRA